MTLSPRQNIKYLTALLLQAQEDNGLSNMLCHQGWNDAAQEWDELRTQKVHVALERLGMMTSFMQQLGNDVQPMKEGGARLPQVLRPAEIKSAASRVKFATEALERYCSKLVERLKRAGFRSNAENDDYEYAFFGEGDQYQEPARDVMTMAERTRDKMGRCRDLAKQLEDNVNILYGGPDERRP
jgi:hypothetical protein